MEKKNKKIKMSKVFPNQEEIIHNTFPYIDGGASISRTARPYPSWLVFKPAMFFTSFLLVKYWVNNKKIIEFILSGKICRKTYHIKKIING